MKEQSGPDDPPPDRVSPRQLRPRLAILFSVVAPAVVLTACASAEVAPISPPPDRQANALQMGPSYSRHFGEGYSLELASGWESGKEQDTFYFLDDDRKARLATIVIVRMAVGPTTVEEYTHNIAARFAGTTLQRRDLGRKQVWHIGRRDDQNQQDIDSYIVDDGGAVALQMTVVAPGDFAAAHLQKIMHALVTLRHEQLSLAASSYPH